MLDMVPLWPVWNILFLHILGACALLQLHNKSLTGHSKVSVVTKIDACFGFGVGTGLGIDVISGVGFYMWICLFCFIQGNIRQSNTEFWSINVGKGRVVTNFTLFLPSCTSFCVNLRVILYSTIINCLVSYLVSGHLHMSNKCNMNAVYISFGC
jgi:hypothetical protein